MGAYLSTPCTEKDSSDEKTELLNCGASSMQGWRINQEDAHNCELNFDSDASLFAVYDGHGGPEIAKYCSKHFPEFLKATEAYLRGDFEQALRDAFLGFDAKLLAPDVIEELKVLAGDKYGEDEDEDAHSDSDEDLAELRQEGGMPIEAVLSKYKNMVKSAALERVKDGEPGGSGSSSAFKPHSPSLRGKKQALTANGDAPKPSEEEAVSSSSTAEVAVDAAPSSSEEQPAKAAAMESPDSSSAEAKAGSSDAAPAAAGSSTGNDVSSSSTAAAAAEAAGSSAAAASSSETPGGSSSAAVNGESSSSSSTSGGVGSGASGISSTNVERAAKRVAMELSKPTADSSDESEEDEKDKTYDQNKPVDSDDTDSDEDKEEDDEDDDEDEDEDDDEEEEEEDYTEMEYDPFLSNMVEEPGKDSGCTAVVAFRHGRMLYVANAGDSRCVLSRSGEVIEMSFDHKPEDDVEHKRISKAGGRVTMDGRVNGGLNLSRAIGDHAYKMNTTLSAAEQMISALPDIKKIELTDKDDFMVLACDGIWNFMSSEAVIQFVKTRLDKGELKLSKICEELFDHCLAKDTSGDGTGCDNMTAIIVRFKWPEAASQGSAEATPALEVGLKRAASSSPLPEPEIAGSEEADGGLKAKRIKTDAAEEAPTTTST